MTDPDRSWTGSMPEIYDRNLGPVLFEPYARELSARIAGGRVLELAAGTGILTRSLVARGLEVTATDLNPAMVSYGARQEPGARWRPADALDLPFDASTFDVVVCQFGVMFFPDKVKAFEEVARVLVPGGTFLFAVWDTLETNDLTAAAVRALNVVFPEDPPTFVARVPHGYFDGAQITADLAAAGLVDVSVETVVIPTSAGSAQQLVTGLAQGSPLRTFIESRGDLDELSSQVGRAMAQELGQGPVSGNLSAVVVSCSTPPR